MSQSKHRKGCPVATVARRWMWPEIPPSGDGSYDSRCRPRHQLLVGLIAVALGCLLPDGLRAESGFVEQFKFSGGIVVALDFDDGLSIVDLATDGPFVVHALLRDGARVAAARKAIHEAGVYGKVSCELYNGRDLPYVDGLVNLVLCKESCEVPQAELMRVLVPGGRLAKEGANGWSKRAKPIPDGLDEWNQFLHGPDNICMSLRVKQSVRFSR